MNSSALSTNSRPASCSWRLLLTSIEVGAISDTWNCRMFTTGHTSRSMRGSGSMCVRSEGLALRISEIM
jgi:hypothetical protein